jgi:hypothetical protein
MAIGNVRLTLWLMVVPNGQVFAELKDVLKEVKAKSFLSIFK